MYILRDDYLLFPPLPRPEPWCIGFARFPPSVSSHNGGCDGDVRSERRGRGTSSSLNSSNTPKSKERSDISTMICERQLLQHRLISPEEKGSRHLQQHGAASPSSSEAREKTLAAATMTTSLVTPMVTPSKLSPSPYQFYSPASSGGNRLCTR